MSKKNIQEPPIKKNAFVHKLYSMLNDPKLSHLIWWTRNEESNTFALYPGKEFANALTGYFKHGNVASFVRQLHMYGFHKVSDPQSNDNLSNINKDTPPIWEFKHSSGKFKKNDESSLIYIKRRSSSNSSRNNSATFSENDSSILIPTSSPSPNSFDHLRHHTFHFNQPPPPPPAPPSQQNPYVYYPQPNPYIQYPINYLPMDYQIPHPQHPQQHPQQQHPQQQHPQQQHPQHQQHHQQHQQHPPPHQSPLKQSNSYTSLPDHENHKINVLRHNSDPQQQKQQAKSFPQHYTPNLQFRKIWEPSSNISRPRNSSLLFDPLAPAPTQPTQPTQSPKLNRSITPPPQSTPSIPPPPPNQLGNHILSRNDSTTSSFHRDSIESSSISTRLSIKLPPPSSIHRASSNLSTDELKFHKNSLLSESYSIPNSPSSSFSKKPSSIPISNSIHERLRPSLIELHFGGANSQTPTTNSLPTSISSIKNSLSGVMKLHSDSIRSHSSQNNSIFSNKSSISSLSSSTQRTSSFGSLSLGNSFDIHKHSISIGPHDPVPLPNTINEEEQKLKEEEGEEKKEEEFVRPRSPSSLSSVPIGPRPKFFRSLTPPNLHSKYNQNFKIHSPIPRSSTSFGQHHSHLHHSNPHYHLLHSNLRSPTNSPLSRSILNDTDLESSEEKPNDLNLVKNKVSVNSLLDTSNPSTKLSNINSIINESEHETESEDDKNDHLKISNDNDDLDENKSPKSTNKEIKRQRIE